jgi:hypothetical protein
VQAVVTPDHQVERVLQRADVGRAREPQSHHEPEQRLDVPIRAVDLGGEPALLIHTQRNRHLGRLYGRGQQPLFAHCLADPPSDAWAEDTFATSACSVSTSVTPLMRVRRSILPSSCATPTKNAGVPFTPSRFPSARSARTSLVSRFAIHPAGETGLIEPEFFGMLRQRGGLQRGGVRIQPSVHLPELALPGRALRRLARLLGPGWMDSIGK